MGRYSGILCSVAVIQRLEAGVDNSEIRSRWRMLFYVNCYMGSGEIRSIQGETVFPV